MRALSGRADVLIDLDEDDEAFLQLDELVGLLEEPGGGLTPPQVTAALATALARRARLSLRHDERHDQALGDAERGLSLLEAGERPSGSSPGSDPDVDGPPSRAARADAAPGDLRQLRVELLVVRGRLLNLAGEGEAAQAPLSSALTLADALPDPVARRLFLARARRELGVARAQGSADEGLLELDRAQQLLDAPAGPDEELPAAERQMLVSTRAEVLANANRFDEALALLEARPPDEDWPLLQRAATLEMAGRTQDAAEVGARLIEKLQERLDPRDSDACHELADALLAQAQRTDADDERAQLAARGIGLLEEFPRLPARSLRLLCQLLEVQAGGLEPPEAHETLRRRAHILEDLLRDLDAEVDHVELVRTFLQDGDALMRMGQPHVARRAYTWAVDELEAIEDPEHPAVLGLLPLALNALGHALAACDLWLAARKRADAAVGAAARHLTAPSLARVGELFLFRAIAHVNAGDPEGGVAWLREDVRRMLDVALRDERQGEASRALVELAMNACVLQGEIFVDHLDDVDEAVRCYDQALELCELLPDDPHVKGSILGAKAAMLTERGRPEEAAALLRGCVELFSRRPDAAKGKPKPDEGGGRAGGQGDLAQALVHLAASLTGMGEPREALGTIQRADGLLGEATADEDDDPDQGGDGEDAGAAAQRAGIRSQLYRQRGEALLELGHALLAADELTRSVELSRELVDRGGEARYEAQQRLPVALLLRARAWLAAGEHEDEAAVDLREARRLFRALFEDEARPLHGRRLEEVRTLQRRLRKAPGRE